MRKQIIKINESQLKSIIAEATKRILKEGTTDSTLIDKWNYLLETIGSEQMLQTIFDWNSTERIAQWIEWFEKDGYFEGSSFSDIFDNEEEFD